LPISHLAAFFLLRFRYPANPAIYSQIRKILMRPQKSIIETTGSVPQPQLLDGKNSPHLRPKTLNYFLSPILFFIGGRNSPIFRPANPHFYPLWRTIKSIRTKVPEMRIHLLSRPLLAIAIALCLASAQTTPQAAARLDPNAQPIDADRGAAGLTRALTTLRTRASMLMITAHPDDEDGGMLAAETRGRGARGSLLTLTRGEGGQNAMSIDMYDELGLLRTQELLQADRYYGVDQYWGSVIDYGFSKTREEAIEKWGYERVLSDVVRVVRMTRPLVITSSFVGAPTDGHGNHQVSGQMAQEAFNAAADPNRFPEQIREGLRPWAPAKVYARVPFFAPTKDNTIYDYATDKYVPIRFHNYVDNSWINERPATNLELQEGVFDPTVGLTYLQIGRTGWGFQKSQNGGNTTPPEGLYTATYHRYGSRVDGAAKDASFYDGIDISLAGIASLAQGDTAFLQRGLEKISHLAGEAADKYRPASPSQIAPLLADGLKATRDLLAEVNASHLANPGKSDVAFELKVKEEQFEKALALALEVSFDAVVAPGKEPDNRFGGAQAITFSIAIPGQKFFVQTSLHNEGPQNIVVEEIGVFPSDGKSWVIKADKPAAPSLSAASESKLKFAVAAPEDATLTKAYFTRPNQEQPYYNLVDERFRNLSLAPYPLNAAARLSFNGVPFTLRRVVAANQRIEGIGIAEDPLLVAPAISVSVTPSAGAVPLTSTSFTFSCALRSNVKGPAKGSVRLRLPPGWDSSPVEAPFSFARDGDSETMTFQVTPHSLKAGNYEIRAVANYAGKNYEEGFRMVGYPGLRPYPSYHPATYKAVGVDVKTAQDLHVGFLPGTGDDVPRALEDLGVQLQTLSAADIETGDLSHFDAIVLGVRAYAVRPELRSANGRLLSYVSNGGVLIVQYNVQNFDPNYGPYPLTVGNAPRVVDEASQVKILDPQNPLFTWPNKITAADFDGWEEERGHGFLQKWDEHYSALVETHDPDQDPQKGGLLVTRYGKGIYVYDAFALHRQLPAGVPGAYRILANLVSLAKNPGWR
jgi:LmbE family N-acetylglucosaminyl deacetylase